MNAEIAERIKELQRAIDTAELVLRDLRYRARDSQVVVESKKPAMQIVVRAVCREFQVGEEILFGRARHPEAIDARHAAFALLRRRLCLSSTQVGRFFGRDHGTILSGVVHARDLAESDPAFARKFSRVCFQLQKEGIK